VVVPAGAATEAPSLVADYLLTADGVALPLRTWLPEAEAPRAVVLALHGFNDHANFFANAGAYLAERGIAAYAYDQRGFGGAPNRGLWPGRETLAADASSAATLLSGRHPGVPLYLFGESMGGAVILVAMAGAEPPRVQGIILSAPAVWGKASMPWYQTMALWVAAHTVPQGKLTGDGLGIRPSDNTEMLKALGRDPMVIKGARVDTLFGLVELMDNAMGSAMAVEGQALVLYGEKDQLVPLGAVREMHERMTTAGGSSQVRFALYENGYHLLTRDLGADAVLGDIVAWIERPRAPLPSGADRRAAASGACPAQELCAIVP
jgi:alpha-beta hydrolase superfamily lysophospholipase